MALAFGALGLLLSPVLQLLIARVPHSLAPWTRPACPQCASTLPLSMWWSTLAWLQGGRCPACRGSLGRQGLMVEWATVALFVLLWLRGGARPETAAAALYLSLFVVLAAIDLEHRIVPNRLLLPGAVLALATSWLHPGLVPALLGGVIGYGILFLFFQLGIVVAGRLGLPEEGLGFGDVKLGGFIGLVIGWPAVIPGLMLGFLLGGVGSALLLITRRARGRSYIPYAPFLLAGAALAMLYGQELIGWYVGFYR